MCVKTLPAWKLGNKANGKQVISFKPQKRGKGEFVHIPCGQCIECRLERSRLWAMRCMHEASMYESNCFITLTFNDYFVDPHLSLRKDIFQKFMKRLRKELVPKVPDYWPKEYRDDWFEAYGIRFFHAGEYGEDFKRPHHHAILFNIDLSDRVLKVIRNGNAVYESATILKLWSDPISGESYGFHEISDVTFETCAYVARYCCKKITGDDADEHYSFVDESGNFYDRVPEFCSMSRKPGIGLRWYKKYRDTDGYGRGLIHIRGKVESKQPRYYDNKYEIDCPEEYTIMKEKRLKKAKENDDNSFDRQKVKEVVKKAQVKFLKRSLR